MKITVVFDGTASHSGCRTGWGFSCFLHEAHLLFDTGEDPQKLAHNLDVLGISPQQIKRIFLSHGHFDHTRGIGAFKENLPEIIVQPDLLGPVLHQQLLKKGFCLISPPNPTSEIFPGIRTLVNGEEGLVEQALMIEGQRGWTLLFGCAHGGVDHWALQARSLISGPIDLIMGGFHLYGAHSQQIQSIINQFRLLGVQRLAPCHCTGPEAQQALHQAFGEKCLSLRVGDQVEL